MNKKSKDYISNPHNLKSSIKTILKKIHHDEDPHELNAYKRFIKRNVSIFSRAYFSAYLLKELSDGTIGEAIVENDGDTVTLFVGIGKNRKVYPRDLIGLFASNDAVDPSKIGQIKILDNYSFVEVDPEIAQSIIDAFNGTDFRGRKLTVNFARRKN